MNFVDRKFVTLAALFLWGPMVFAAAPEGEWKPLFNGRDFTGWHTVLSGLKNDQDPDRIIQVEDGAIHVYKDAKADSEVPYGFLCTDAEFSNYRLRFQYKWGKKRYVPRTMTSRDAGVLYHVVSLDSVYGVWPMSVECQVQEGDVGDLITVGTRCTAYVDPAMKDKPYPLFRDPKDGGVEHDNKWYIKGNRTRDHLEGWNNVEVIVHGADSAVHIVNGHVNQRLKNIRRPTKKDEWVPLDKGRIAFQVEGAEIYYRNIEIQELSAKFDPANDRPSAPPTIVAIKREQPSPVGTAFTPPQIDVPEGFEVTLAAATPLVEHPMMGCLDDRGRMFIAESDGGNRQAQQLLDERPHKMLMLEDTDHDGVYDKRVVFADNLVLPNGAQWYDGALYVCSGSFLWRFRDKDNDGRADEATPIAGTFDFGGMSSAFHGPVLGPDGRFYWSGGQHGWTLEPPAAGQARKRADTKALGYDAGLAGPWTRNAPGVFSCLPDGSDAENLAYGGICNPVETAFTPEGEVLGTVSVYDADASRRRDAILHWIDGGVFNLAEKNYAGIVRTGKDLTPLIYRGHAAPAGITRYQGNQFGKGFRDNYFFAEFNTHKIYRLLLEQVGATFRGHDEVFLSSPNTDTHFTDVIEDADGSLLVMDTGGWFLYGCPTSQIAKPSIAGAIYRVRKKGVAKVDDPRGNDLKWDVASDADLVARLDDRRPAVQDRALNALSKRGDKAISALQQSLETGSPETRLQCVWALTRIRSDAARDAIRRLGLGNTDSIAVRAAVHSVSVNRDEHAKDALTKLLSSSDIAIRREAAAALGRIGARSAVPALLSAAAQTGDDRFLEHAVTLALIRIGDDKSVAAGLSDASPQVRRAALVALDQMKSKLLTREMLAPLLESGNDVLEQATLGVLRTRPEWADDIAGRLASWLAEPTLSAEREAEVRAAIRAFWSNKAVVKVVADALVGKNVENRTKIVVLESIALADADQLPDVWIDALGKSLSESDKNVVRQAIATISARNLASFDSSLLTLAQSSKEPNVLRLAATFGLLRHAQKVPGDIFDLLCRECSANVDAVDRLAAAQALGTAPLSDGQRLQLTQLVADAGPLELPALLGAFDGGSNAEIGEQLVRSLAHTSGLAGLPAGRLTTVLRAYPVAVQSAAAPLVAKLGASSSEQADRMRELLEKLKGGNPQNGHEVFFGQQASCSVCHRIGNQGGNIGPDLSRIGEIRAPRDLIESVVFPSSSFARGFEPLIAMTNAGKSYSGIMSRETPQAIYIRSADRNETRIARSDIDALTPGTVSIMPQGFDKQLTVDQMRDLIAFLGSLKQ